ncbi:hypothetical protein TFLX_02156 [Thermoflexales bacterium]|nr:hypothetical protein TFLX_02156 [Thermoflexales bacterium]
MRTQQRRPGLLVLSVILLASACQSPQSVSTPPTPIAPVTLFEVNTVSTVAPTPVRQTSGVRLAANIDLKCAEAAQPNAECLRPYSGEFVITTLNGAEVARVMTDDEGQATVDLPPGKYILGVRTEEIYPLAAPVKVNVLADRYVHISLSLDSGKQP